MATDIAWPQDAAGLIEMANDWPLPTDDSGAMFSGDVLIHKLGATVRELEQARDEAVRVLMEVDHQLRNGLLPDGHLRARLVWIINKWEARDAAPPTPKADA